MKKLLAASIAAAAFCSAPAIAADMPVKAPIYKAVTPPFDWTGFYAGGQVGYAWGDATFFIPGILIVPTVTAKIDPNGIFGGGHLGYNWQFGKLVAGIESDINARDIHGSNNTVTH